jgi:RNA polymerase sigma-70 factor, ECF subfamily
MNKRPAVASNAGEDRAKEAEVDRALVLRAQAGEMEAFRRLVERHQRRAFALAFALVREENDARELVQEAFLRVFKNLPTFQSDSSFYTWLYRILTNLGIDLLRKPGRDVRQLEEEVGALDGGVDVPLLLGRYEGADPVETIRRREIGQRLQTAFDELPSYHRAVIVLRELEGLSYEEMASIMSVSKGTIMSRLFHARKKLQRVLADCYTEQVGPLPEEHGQRERER